MSENNMNCILQLRKTRLRNPGSLTPNAPHGACVAVSALRGLQGLHDQGRLACMGKSCTSECGANAGCKLLYSFHSVGSQG